MKKYLCGIFALIIVVAFCSSCQKDIDESVLNRTTTDSTIIWKYIEMDTALPIGLDTMSIMTLDYDNNGRLIGIKKVEKDRFASPSAIFPHFENSVYSYNGNSSLPLKVITSKKDMFGDSNDTTFLSYSNGIVSKDSTRSKQVDPAGFIIPTIMVNYYTRSGSNIIVTQYRDTTLSPSSWPPACPGTTTYQQTISNGNIVLEIGSYTSCLSTGSSYVSFTYDNKPNPFYPLSLPYLVFSEGLISGVMPKNNVLANLYDNTGTDGVRYSYTYRADGYPIVAHAYDISHPSDSWKIIYVYK